MKSTQTGNLSSPRMLKCTLLVSLAALATGVSAFADVVVINNFSFESPIQASDGNFVATGSGSGISGTFNSWGYFVANGASFEDFGIENPGGAAYTGATGAGTPSGADGTQVAFLNNNNAGLVSSLFQDVGLLQANTQYTLTVAIGQRLDRVNGSVQIGLINAASGSTDAFGSGTMLNSITAISSVAGSFQDFVVTFTTGDTVSDDLYVGAKYTADGTVQGSVDNFRLDATAVPEPGTVAMLLGGAGLLLIFRRSRS